MLAQSLKLVGSLEPYRRVVLSADENFCRIEEGQDLGKWLRIILLIRYHPYQRPGANHTKMLWL